MHGPEVIDLSHKGISKACIQGGSIRIVPAMSVFLAQYRALLATLRADLRSKYNLELTEDVGPVSYHLPTNRHVSIYFGRIDILGGAVQPEISCVAGGTACFRDVDQDILFRK